MDLDTTRSRSGYEHIIDQFERGETDILVGTQMVTKGLDFDRVSLVGVFNADRMMHFPDFRSHERAYQLITQVSGRAGRRDIRGKVVIQTSSPDHAVLVHILQNDFEAFYHREIADREAHYFPPFARLIEITVKHADKKICRNMSHQLAELLTARLQQVRILGPAEPMVSKVRNQYLMSLLIKIPRGKGELHAIKDKLTEAVNEVMKEKERRTGRVIIDVDPV
jgi:primosomal protein N' (replication factor Y)